MAEVGHKSSAPLVPEPASGWARVLAMAACTSLTSCRADASRATASAEYSSLQMQAASGFYHS